MLLGRGVDNKLVMSDVGYVTSFSGSFHGWNEFLTLLPDSFSVVLIHIDVGAFQILSLSQNSHFPFFYLRNLIMIGLGLFPEYPDGLPVLCTFNHHLTTVQVKFLIDHTPSSFHSRPQECHPQQGYSFLFDPPSSPLSQSSLPISPALF